MRLISWDGRRDVSYENCHLVINPKTFEIEAITGNTNFEPVMGIYSTEAKALKVMEMLREKYAKLEIFKSVYQEGLLTELNKELGFDGMQNILTSIFQFPKDEEVEVQEWVDLKR